jgi:hypothetical protein
MQPKIILMQTMTAFPHAMGLLNLNPAIGIPAKYFRVVHL